MLARLPRRDRDVDRQQMEFSPQGLRQQDALVIEEAVEIVEVELVRSPPLQQLFRKAREHDLGPNRLSSLEYRMRDDLSAIALGRDDRMDHLLASRQRRNVALQAKSAWNVIVHELFDEGPRPRRSSP